MSLDTYSWPRPPRANASWWTTNNPVLRDGEFAIEKDTDKFKVGDGATAYNDLPYYESAENVLTAAALLFAPIAPAYATVDRPDASTVAAGTSYYDTTLSKPAWSDGAAWKDAAGTTV